MGNCSSFSSSCRRPLLLRQVAVIAGSITFVQVTVEVDVETVVDVVVVVTKNLAFGP